MSAPLVSKTTVERPEGRLLELADVLAKAPDLDELNLTEVSREYGVSSEFIDDVVTTLQAPESVPKGQDLWRTVSSRALRWWDSFKAAWARETQSPTRFVAVTCLVAVILVFLWNFAGTVFGGLTPLDGTFGAAIIVGLIFVAQLACYFQRGQVRWPLIGGLVVAGYLFLLGFMVSRQPIASIVAAFVLSSISTLIGIAAALVGGYWAVRRTEAQHHEMTRQEQLDRLFALGDQLRSMKLDARDWKRSEDGVIPAAARTAWPLVAAFIGLGIGLAYRIVNVVLVESPDRLAGAPDNLVGLVQVLTQVVGFGALFVAGYFATSVRQAVLSVLLAGTGILASDLAPWIGGGWQAFMASFRMPDISVKVALWTTIGLLSGFGSQIEASSRHGQRLKSQDPAALFAEMVRVKRRLGLDSGARCVVSVDVARSTAMKGGEDPLVVEWSFREYQAMVSKCTAKAGGDVLSTSGDGAVLVFASPADALRASKEIQTKLGRFNARVNRLQSPFRVRIGIHADEVQGHLSDVQFTSLIDIAAHLQHEAPVGGILVTQAVAERIGDEPLAALKDPVEGRQVHLVVSPTLGA